MMKPAIRSLSASMPNLALILMPLKFSVLAEEGAGFCVKQVTSCHRRVTARGLAAQSDLEGPAADLAKSLPDVEHRAG